MNISYKCLSCGAELKFNPKTGSFICDYCGTEFTKKDIDKDFVEENNDDTIEKEKKYESIDEDEEYEKEEDVEDDELSDVELSEYTCNNCGAKIITDKTTIATECYYCHNPIIMTSKITGNNIPKKIIPFKIDDETAKDRFKTWISAKSFAPDDFGNKKNINQMYGVYFPYWVVDSENDIKYSAEIEESIISGNTKTHNIYSIKKEGTAITNDLILSAFSNARKSLLEGIPPFEESDAVKFSPAYLSGFQAEEKDISESELESEATIKIKSCIKKKFAKDFKGTTSLKTDKLNIGKSNDKWDYTLMPVWIMTYEYKKEMYYFAMNGQTGKVCGKIPLDENKLKKHLRFNISLFSLISMILFIMGGLIR